MKNQSLKKMVTSAILIAMGTVLSFLQIPLPWLIWGGSVTVLSMLPICTVGIMYGPLWGFGSAFLYSVMQLLFAQVGAWGLSPTVLVVCIVFDYLVAFTVLGVTGFFRSRGKKGICIGVGIAVFCRFVCHFITGVTIWKEMMPESFSSPWLYSLAYNGSYMLPELIFTVAGAAVLAGMPRFMRMIKQA